MQTICSTGIRVSELNYFTVEAVRRGEELYLRLPPEMALPAEGCYHGLDKTHGGRPVLLTVREGAIAWRGEATEQEPVELAFLGRG